MQNAGYQSDDPKRQCFFRSAGRGSTLLRVDHFYSLRPSVFNVHRRYGYPRTLSGTVTPRLMTHSNPRADSLPRVAVALTLIGLAISAILAALVGADVIRVAWNAKLLPWLTLAGLVPFCVVGLVVSCSSYYLHRDIRSVIAIVLGVIATAASISAFFLIVFTSIARHPFDISAVELKRTH